MNYFIMYKSCYWYFFFPSQPVSKIVNKLHRILWLILVKCVLKTKNVKCTCKMGCKFICCCCLVTKLYPCLSNSMDCSPPASFVHGISLARTLEWVAISFSRGSSGPGIKPVSPALTGAFFTTDLPGKLPFLLLEKFNILYSIGLLIMNLTLDI